MLHKEYLLLALLLAMALEKLHCVDRGEDLT
jgi:hypothetical protein